MVPRRCQAFLLAGLFAVASPPSSNEPQITVSSQVDKTQVAAGEPITFSVTIAGPLATEPKVTLPSFEGFRVVSTGQSQSVRWQGGVQQRSVTLQYLLLPAEAGKYTLGPVVVEHDGQTYKTTPIAVEVTDEEAGPHSGLSLRPEEGQPPRPKRPPLRGGTVL